jgi:hypothetical protein
VKERFDEVPDWEFESDEVSAGVYKVVGTASDGRRVEMIDTDCDALVKRARLAALALGPEAKRANPEHRSTVTYQCLFCGEGVAPGEHDPCAIVVVARIDQLRAVQKEQTFYCHLGCLQAGASVHPRTFYIADPAFPTIGECAAASGTAPEEVAEESSRPAPGGQAVRAVGRSTVVETAAEQIAALPWGDVTLRGIRWRVEDAGMDLTIEGRGEYEFCLRCSWVSQVRSTLSFAGGPALTWDVDFVRLPEGGWQVCFDFASRGELELTCGEIRLVRPPGLLKPSGS